MSMKLYINRYLIYLIRLIFKRFFLLNQRDCEYKMVKGNFGPKIWGDYDNIMHDYDDTFKSSH